MTALFWDQPGERRYETGVDRGVLYFPDGGAVVWNGLVSVVEGRSRTVKSYFMDGVKYLDNVVPGVYSAKIQAFTYPKELDALLGNSEIAPGVVAYDQPIKMFSLSYRTMALDDVANRAYKIHLVYNVTAYQSDATFNSISDTASGSPFEWNLVATPDPIFGIRPTSHISLDSREIDPTLLANLEQKLYGSDTADPVLPSLASLYDLVTP